MLGYVLFAVLVAAPVVLFFAYAKKRKEAKETDAKTFFKTKDGK